MDLSRAVDFLLPKHCLLCRGRSRENLCTGCDSDLPEIAEACYRCAIPLEPTCRDSAIGDTSAGLCGACISKPPPYHRAAAALDYVFPTTVLVQRFKFNRNFACGRVLSERLIRALRQRFDWTAGRVELLVPVPLHPARQFLRAFNQAELLARDIGQALGIAVASRALRRTRRTPAQLGLSADERRKNLRGAISAGKFNARHVALVDDVMTTGATVGECAAALRRAGVETVSVWVAARAA